MLGQVVDLNTTAFPYIEPKLRQFDTELKRLESAIRTNPALAQAMGRDLIDARNRLTGMIAEYQRIRALLGMSPAAGLGLAPIWIVLAVAASIATLWIAVQGYQSLLDWLKEREYRLAVEAAAAAGQQIPPRSDSDFGLWLEKNAWWLLAGTAAIVLVPRLLD